MRDRQMMYLVSQMVRGQGRPQRSRRGCGCSPFWIVFVLMLPCDILVLLGALGVLPKLLAQFAH
jgi:hypothetical protein